MFRFVALLCVISAVTAVKPVEFNACDSDVDCEPSNSVCFDGLGPTDQRRCMCTYGYAWDSVNHRCDLPHLIANASTVVVTRQSALYYSEQNNQSQVAVLAFTRGRAVLPSQWFCDRTTKFCVAYDASLGIEVANFNYTAIANTSNTTGVPGVYQYWRCTNSSIGRATRLNENMIMNATAVQQGYGMRPLWEFCPPCSVWCQHGVCSSDGSTCACTAGWFGTRCDQQSTLVSLGRYDDTRPCTFVNESSACGILEQCYFSRKLSRGVCWCAPGAVPDPATVWGGGCMTTVMVSVPSLLVDFVPNDADWRYFNGTYAAAFPQYSWVQDATTLYALRSSATTGLTDPAWRINSSLLLLERCLQPQSQFFARREFLNSSTVIANRNQHVWCGFGGGAGSCGPLSVGFDPWLGSCTCRSGVTGTYCDTCVGNFTGPNCTYSTRSRCRTNYCNGRGECVDAQPLGTCVCDRPYLADSTCAVSATACGQANCSAHGECVDTAATSCVCDSGWKGAKCQTSDATCRAQRCSNHGNCATETQGCTCDAFYMRSNCSRVYCAYEQPVVANTGTCLCNASFIGAHCETRRCGMYGDVTARTNYQSCECFGVMALNFANQTCTSHICGARGYPYGGRWCTCYPGSRLVPTHPTTQCQKPCSVHTILYNTTTDQCICEVGFSGDLCDTFAVTKQPVPRQWTILINYAFTALLGLFVLVNMWMPHLRFGYTHVRLGRPNTVQDVLLTPQGQLLHES